MRMHMQVALVLSAWLALAGGAAAGPPVRPSPQDVARTFAGRKPLAFGAAVAGVKTRLATSAPDVALTFDLCGRGGGKACDGELLALLKREKIAATFFVGGGWVRANERRLGYMAREPLFELESHGLRHRPCSVEGKSVFGLVPTSNVGEVVEEIEGNALRLERVTGKRPRFFRPGGAALDDVSVEIARALGQTVVGYTVNGDMGATATADQVRAALAGAPNGSIVLLHGNRPGGGTAQGLGAALPELRRRGVRFVRLDQGGLR